ncbi:hypothetical protein [Coxiella-like endosymbiont]|uniref:hypothetical protein n=1 Tax=Coxiella-like endosymbiont TaxID=1592897 RepID=UPI00272BA9B7|nr:hypothetical protein [Coxiella-like endosymbiont]
MEAGKEIIDTINFSLEKILEFSKPIVRSVASSAREVIDWTDQEAIVMVRGS